MNSDGSGLAQITTNSYPDWYGSPNPIASLILFTTKDPAALTRPDQVATMDYTGLSHTLLTGALAGDNDDGAYNDTATGLSFVNDASGAYQLYWMDPAKPAAMPVWLAGSASYSILGPAFLHDAPATATLSPSPSTTPSTSLTPTPSPTASQSPTATPRSSPSPSLSPTRLASLGSGRVLAVLPLPNPQHGPNLSLAVKLDHAASSLGLQVYDRAFVLVAEVQVPGPFSMGWNKAEAAVPTLANGAYFVRVWAMPGGREAGATGAGVVVLR
jgi:hypothetical protein